jgi:hypothetical protein
MARRHQARDYVLQGFTPQEIAQKMGISLSTVRQYLCTLVGEGDLLRTDITLSIASKDRTHIEKVLGPGEQSELMEMTSHLNWQIYRKRRRKIPVEVISLYLLVRDPRPDLYALICTLETTLHDLVKNVLQNTHGDDWWRKGIPNEIRKSCHSRREDDDDPVSDPYQYTNLIDLKTVIEKQWGIFSKNLPENMAANKPETLRQLQRINAICNKVMHPVKGIGEYKEDYTFVRSFLEECNRTHWRIGADTIS